MTAVLLAPHNDDETLFASFLILRYRPKVIVCLRSERMHQRGYPGGKCSVSRTGRERETGRALAVLREAGIMGESGFEQWDISDADPDWDEISKRIADEVKRANLVIYPAYEEGGVGNEQHNRIAEIADELLVASGRAYLRYTTYTVVGRSRAGREVEFEPHWPALKMTALACYRSQIAHPATAAHFLDGGLREYVAS